MTHPLDAKTELRVTLEHLWSQLSRPHGAVVESTAIAVQLQEGPVRVGIDGEGRRHLLLPMPLHATGVADDLSRGVHLSTRTLVSEDSSVRYADLVCARADLSSVFTGLASDICLTLLARPQDPGLVALTHLEDWRALLGTEHRTWTLPHLGGLTGELMVLDRLLDLDPSATRWWCGPLGEAQDFRSPTHAIEVKTNLAKEGRVVTIHGADQLEPPVGGLLGLMWFRLRYEPETGSIRLVDLISRCANRGGAAAVLDRLDKVGLPAASSPEVEGARFELVEERWYSVDDQFPAITPARFVSASVPAGVGGLEYLVDLDAVPAQKRPMEELLRIFLEHR